MNSRRSLPCASGLEDAACEFTVEKLLPFVFELVFHGGIEPLFKIFEIGGDVHGQTGEDVLEKFVFYYE